MCSHKFRLYNIVCLTTTRSSYQIQWTPLDARIKWVTFLLSVRMELPYSFICIYEVKSNTFVVVAGVRVALSRNHVATLRAINSRDVLLWQPYGYYADVDNDCKIFHVCLPLQQLFPLNFTTPITYQFSFFCNLHTVFSQVSNPHLSCTTKVSLFAERPRYCADKQGHMFHFL